MFLFLLSTTFALTLFAFQPTGYIDYPSVSEQLVETVQHSQRHAFDSLLKIVADAKFEVLKNQLYSDTRKKTFWLNVHNAYALYLLKKEPSILKNHNHFLSTKQITIAGMHFSLNEIEHGILRRSSYRITETVVIKQLRVLELDYRVHFGINFGAKDCPSLVPFREHKLNDQLKSLEKAYILSHTAIDSAKKEIKTSELFEWYETDFGGENGVRNLFEKNGLVQAKDWKISYEA
ncbi:MAG: DUF547 domain-containing protein, partial [Bacteroidota bacterium]